MFCSCSNKPAIESPSLSWIHAGHQRGLYRLPNSLMELPLMHWEITQHPREDPKRIQMNPLRSCTDVTFHFCSSKHASDSDSSRNVHNMFNRWRRLLTTWRWLGVRLDVQVLECQSWKAKEYERIHRSQYFVSIQWIGAKLLLASMIRCFIPPRTTQIFSRQSTDSGFNVCLKTYVTEHLDGAMPIWIRQCPPNIAESVIHGYNSNKAHKRTTKVMEAKNWSEHIHNESSSSLAILPFCHLAIPSHYIASKCCHQETSVLLVSTAGHKCQ